MTESPARNAGIIVHAGIRRLQDIAGFDQVSTQEAVTLMARGITTVELPDGRWLAANYDGHTTEAPPGRNDSYHSMSGVQRFKVQRFKAAIPTEWREASHNEALELRKQGAMVIMCGNLVLVPQSLAAADTH